ncbi:MAG: radical SAM protein, partial [Planctomycetes bacterium]|nr:radical SAM protein [Planctomycetota bacterium]
VLDTISYIASQTNIWLEITTLLIPGENDSDNELKKLADFIVSNAGIDTPWHISRFHPDYKYLDSQPTPVDSLERAQAIGKAAGLRYVYPGNISESKAESTFCYSCGKLLIERIAFHTAANNVKNSCCPDCGTKIAGFEL